MTRLPVSPLLLGAVGAAVALTFACGTPAEPDTGVGGTSSVGGGAGTSTTGGTFCA